MARITLKDVAFRAGVSYQTVSKVLNKQAQVAPPTEIRIWQAVRELNYEPDLSARRLRAQTSHLIGYAWHHTLENSLHPILDGFLHSAAHAATSQGYHIFTFVVATDAPANIAPYAELYARRQVDGFILADTVQNDPRLDYLLAQGIPFATFGRSNNNWDFAWVDVDGRYGTEITVAHLTGRGHRRIALITWPEGSQSGWFREQGYLAGLRAAAIEPAPVWIVRGDNSARTGAEGMVRLLRLPEAERPTAVVCVSDLIAIGALNAAADGGLAVGRDIAVTGFDDIPTAEYLRPPLTTVRQPIAEVGQTVIDLLLQQIRGNMKAGAAGTTTKGVLLKPELVVRASS